MKSSIFVVYLNQKNCFLYAHPGILHLNHVSAVSLPGRSGLEGSLSFGEAGYDISNILAPHLHPLVSAVLSGWIA